MSACWRALAQHPGVEALHVLAWKVGTGEKAISFNDQIMQGLNYDLLDSTQREDDVHVQSLVRKARPDVIVLCGWAYSSYRRLPFVPEFSGLKFVMTMDTPFSGSLRQRLGRLKVGKFLDRMDGVVTGGERSYQLAKFLKIPEAKLMCGMYGFDSAPLENIQSRRAANAWPKKFTYIGRYVPDKAIDVLIEGYSQYRKETNQPWPLECFGRGEDADRLRGVDGITDRGFIQPENLPGALLDAGAYVIASRYEPWGVSIAEAAYSGLPILCTQACGASVEVVRHLHSGYICPSDNPRQLAAGFRWMHEHYDRLPEIGARGVALAQPFSMNFWASRWHHFMGSL
jgi:glycosyltransferase involved in cell wall biosynthesis